MIDGSRPRSRPSASSPGLGVSGLPDNFQPPSSPRPPSNSAQKQPTDVNHARGDSAVSQSSYRTSFASSRYGESTARSSSNSFSRGFRSFMEEVPPVPPAPLRTSNKSFTRDSNSSGASSRMSKEEVNGFDFGITPTQNSPKGLDDLPEEPPSTEYQDRTEYSAYQAPQTHLHPATAAVEPGSDAPRKNSNASTTSAFSVTSFARALGLEDQMNHPESSDTSDSSPSDARSGSSMSSLPSDTSLNGQKPNDPLNPAH